MKLRSKLVMAVVILFIIPVISAVAGMGFVTHYQSTMMQSEYGFNMDTLESVVNPIKLVDMLTDNSFKEIERYTATTADKLNEYEFLDEINGKLDTSYAFLVVRKDYNYIYIGDGEVFTNLDSSLPTYASNVNDGDMTYISGKHPCMVKQKDFLFTDGGRGSAFIVVQMDDLLPHIKRLLFGVVAIAILVTFITTIFLITWMYRSILSPINTLSMAANRISNGDYDFSIADKKNQIGSIFDDFENMRIQLKDLIEKQTLYEKESRELISNISHDLKTPLSSIKGYAEGILDGVAATPDRQEKYLRTIYTKAVAMTALVDELSLYSKIEGNEVPIDKKPVNVDSYFTECVEGIILDVEINGMRMNYINTVEKDVNVIMDVEQIRRVFNNLITNAVKYVEVDNGQILVRIDDEGDDIHIAVADNGKGIAPEDLPYIFDRFYRTDASRNSKKGGSGLGLSIAKKIIEKHDGKIWATSMVNVGTTIHFTLPKQKLLYKEKEEKSLRMKTIYPILKVTTAMRGKHMDD